MPGHLAVRDIWICQSCVPADSVPSVLAPLPAPALAVVFLALVVALVVSAAASLATLVLPLATSVAVPTTLLVTARLRP